MISMVWVCDQYGISVINIDQYVINMEMVCDQYGMGV